MGTKRTLTGEVVSDKMDKTVVVRISRLRQHPRYKKYIEYRKKCKAHDEHNACEIGDRVKLVETRPLSGEKRWRVLEILSKSSPVKEVEG
ncbi:MAG: 30S ribosomal protein S17 [Dehalococcoidia bacterium]